MTLVERVVGPDSQIHGCLHPPTDDLGCGWPGARKWEWGEDWSPGPTATDTNTTSQMAELFPDGISPTVGILTMSSTA